MFFRKIDVRPGARSSLHVGFTTLPPRRRIVATWRRDETTGRKKLVWKLLDAPEFRVER
jgi:hypothetical protein